MPNVFKQPQYKRSGGSVKIPDSAFSPVNLPEEETLEEQELQELQEEMVKARFEPAVPTREELMARCEDELNDLRREAAQQAYTDALNAKRGELQQCMDKVNETLAEMERIQRDYMERYAEELKFLAVDIAETVLRTKIQEDELALKELVVQAVSRTRNADWLDVTVSEKLTGLVDRLKEEFQKPEYRGRASVTPMPVPADTVRIQTQLGTTDASVSVQTERLKSVFNEDMQL